MLTDADRAAFWLGLPVHLSITWVDDTGPEERVNTNSYNVTLGPRGIMFHPTDATYPGPLYPWSVESIRNMARKDTHSQDFWQQVARELGIDYE